MQPAARRVPVVFLLLERLLDVFDDAGGRLQVAKDGGISQRAADDGFARIGRRVEVIHDFSDGVPRSGGGRGGGDGPYPPLGGGGVVVR